MKRYVVKRLLFVIPTILVVIFIVLGIMHLTPSDPAHMILGPNVSQEAYDQLNHELGYDRPFLIQYINYVIDLCKGDMGNTYSTGQPVFDEVIRKFPTTAKLASASIVFALLLGIPLGILAAVKQYSIYDILGTSFSMLMASVPAFWLGMMAILLFALRLGWLPSNGNDTWRHFVLPTVTLGVASAASILRLTRTTMLETIRQDYIRTARAKGQTENKIITRHALKNALLPVVTVAAMDFGSLLGGAVVVETVFSLNGLGFLIVEGIRMKDVPLVTGAAVFLAFFFMLVMLGVDLIYAYIDPRVRARYQKG